MKARQIALLVFRVLVGLFFVADGLIKLTGISQTIEMFDRIGWGQWFRYFTGCLVLFGGIAILLRLRWTFYGAVVCACTVGTGALLYAFSLHYNPTLPAGITLVTIALAVLTYSARSGRSLHPAARRPDTP